MSLTKTYCSGIYPLALILSLSLADLAHARSTHTFANLGMQSFATHCFSPFLTRQKAVDVFRVTGFAYDFYDLDPFSSAAPSPAEGREVTVGTDRRCEISFDGTHGLQAADVAVAALKSEGLDTRADVPAHFIRTQDTTLLAARRLNPRRVAVVHVGTRVGENGIETFMSVERLLPEQVEG